MLNRLFVVEQIIIFPFYFVSLSYSVFFFFYHFSVSNIVLPTKLAAYTPLNNLRE